MGKLKFASQNDCHLSDCITVRFENSDRLIFAPVYLQIKLRSAKIFRRVLWSQSGILSETWRIKLARISQLVPLIVRNISISSSVLTIHCKLGGALLIAFSEIQEYHWFFSILGTNPKWHKIIWTEAKELVDIRRQTGKQELWFRRKFLHFRILNAN